MREGCTSRIPSWEEAEQRWPAYCRAVDKEIDALMEDDDDDDTHLA